MMNQILMLGLGVSCLPLLLRLAIRLRLGIPMAYAVLALTVLHGWYQAHPALGDGIFFALVGLVVLSWVITLGRRLIGAISDWRADRAAAELLACRVREARANGQSTVSTCGLY